MKSPNPPPATKVAMAAIPTISIADTLIPARITGQAKGNPGPKDIIGVFEARHRTPADLGLPPLLLQYAADWDLD